MFGFRTAKVFDPSLTMLRAAAAGPVPLVLLWAFGPVGGVAGLLVMILWLYQMSRIDQQLVNAVAVRIRDLDIVHLLRDTSPHADVVVADGIVARVDRRLRLHAPAPLRVGRRVVQLLLDGPRTRYLWIDGGVLVEIDRTEALGALDVVLAGDDLGIDHLIGGLPGIPPRPLAVHVRSTAGSVVSFDQMVQPTLCGTAGPGIDDRIADAARRQD